MFGELNCRGEGFIYTKCVYDRTTTGYSVRLATHTPQRLVQTSNDMLLWHTMHAMQCIIHMHTHTHSYLDACQIHTVINATSLHTHKLIQAHSYTSTHTHGPHSDANVYTHTHITTYHHTMQWHAHPCTSMHPTRPPCISQIQILTERL